MKKINKYYIALQMLLLSLIAQNAFAFENLFYTMRYTSLAAQPEFNRVLSTVNAHADNIQIIVSQAYKIKADGSIAQGFNPNLQAVANQHHIKFMALVSNPGDSTHRFLQNTKAQSLAVQLLLRECFYYHLYGLQLDFENVAASDRNALTQFYKQLASALHKNGFAVSIAITPRIADTATSAFQAARYANWTGAFDYKALGKSSDFVTLMAYDQHTGSTTPGPIGSLAWAEQVIQYALKYIPANKISLGIPTYSGYWRTAKHGKSIYASGEQIDYATSQNILRQHQQALRWDEREGVYYAFYEHNELNEFLFCEEARSFGEKYKLAKRYNLRGVSVWRLGMEDAGVWNKL